MIHEESFTESHIRGLQKDSKKDPILIERTIFAFGLLEAITRVGMPYVFKGGTCLLLLLGSPKRLSTDIDIIVPPGTDVSGYIREAAGIFPFEGVEEQVRVGRNNIEKRHFKFIYSSPIGGAPLYILLDVLYEDIQYGTLVEKEIRNDLLVTGPEYVKVRIPSISCILGDKLTAFAPHTTGILLGTGRDMEIMKQMYDISNLLDEFESWDDVRDTYFRVVRSELGYRGMEKDARDCLLDTLEASVCIASRGKVRAEEYSFYVRGIRDVRTHIYSENYSPEVAVGKAARTAYAVACLLTDTEYVSVEDYLKYTDEKISIEQFMPLRYLRKANPEAYAYIVKSDQLLG